MNLHPYQIKGAAFLADRREAYLADEPGLGKTAQAIKAVDDLNLPGGAVVGPAFLRTNWAREFGKWSTMNRKVYCWESAKDKPPDDADVVCVSYNLTTTARFAAWCKARGEFIIVDEAHYLKNRAAKRTRAMFGKTLKSNGLFDHFDHKYLLSGTPMLNTADDLYPWMKRFGAFQGGYWDFVDRFCTGYTGDYGFKITGNKNVPELREAMAPYLLRRRLKDVAMELPDIIVQSLTVDPMEIDPAVPKLIELYDWEAVMREVMGGREDILAQLKDLNLNERKKMTHARQVVGLLKIRSYASLINDDLYTWRKDKVVIFAIHKGVIDALRIFIESAGYSTKVIYGGTKMANRERWVEMFNEADLTTSKFRVLICNIAAAGVGLNITGCNHVDILEPSWTPADNEQAIKRLHRIGQQRKVVARFIGLAGSVDEYISEVLARKSQDIHDVMG